MATQGKQKLTELLGIAYPIFAFTHCRDVVVAVSKAGGMGVLGAAVLTDQQLEIDLRWIEDKLGDTPYGVDLMMPSKYVGAEEGGISRVALDKLIPEEHRKFAEGLLEKAGIPPLPADSSSSEDRGMRYSQKETKSVIDISFAHKPRLLVSALGTPPAYVIEGAHQRGIPVAALAGQRKHAERHKAAGVDIIIAQSYEAGGHTGDIGGMVLIPEIVDAVAPTPVLAAGGVMGGRQMAAALALGAQGVWCGSIWLTTTESELDRMAKEKLLASGTNDTTRTKSITGKHARFLKSQWTEEWDRPDTPAPLEAPLQPMLWQDCFRRVHRALEAPGTTSESGAYQLYTYPVGQGVGTMNDIRSAREVVRDMITAYVETIVNLNDELGDGSR